MDNPDMISPDERFSIALDVLKRLKAELAAQKAAQSAAQAAQETGFTPAAPAGSRLEYALAGTPAGQPDTLTLQGYLKGHASLPPHSAVLGAGEDGLPFLLDLVDATPGALLVLEDEAEEARRLLRTLLTSASLLNPPRELDLRLVTARPEAYSAVRRQTAFKQAASPLERAAGHMVSELAALAEHRLSGQRLGTNVILAIDDLPALAQNYLFKGHKALIDLVQNGPLVGVWTVAVASHDQAAALERTLVESFSTHIIGRANHQRLADPRDVLEEGQFRVWSGGEWYHFWSLEA
jgi:hypothetical protein